MNHQLFGWIWINLGLLSGAILGLGFLRPDFLGGYVAPARRLVRLGHISFIGLGGLNVLFALSVPDMANDSISLTSFAFIAAAVSMPLVCFAVAWRESLFTLFVIPVSCALFATTSVVLELMS